ncbi:putative SLIT-ROBO Rho GTPase-activating protein 3 isoform [Sesbania bispinosa]|nr:putative SLIT-ROBO Rho GTPase-activating protein 3 isoform [Sesbania bispinosa]
MAGSLVRCMNWKKESKSGERDDCGLWRIGDGQTSLSAYPPHWLVPSCGPTPHKTFSSTCFIFPLSCSYGSLIY